LFPVLKTFVAPIFPDPIVLISFFKKIFVIINPNGIDPKMYEYTKIIKNSVFIVD
jgi:hypothetical protein